MWSLNFWVRGFWCLGWRNSRVYGSVLARQGLEIRFLQSRGMGILGVGFRVCALVGWDLFGGVWD